VQEPSDRESPDQTYLPTLLSIRRKRRQLLFMLAIWFLAFVLLGLAATTLNNDMVGFVAFAVAGAGLIPVGVLWDRAEAAECPRCRQLFFTRRWARNILASRCLHCGLRLPGRRACP
jgi:hypothetical protein